ncbi:MULTISPECIES: membrane-bound lytic murein transglycosylase MltF [Halomonadaceae]|uniref:membrane-bound lytic murein transglycosylase MltF n=1 Tax=Halomonadaceae TaxID=28256 RepID=UPI0018EFC6B9|nr:MULTISPECIES: membrane-bound lytic murein transglycosylase MltF [Halomonas]MCW4152440.1 membrane-bound lytic murein transglycosylase MltF [Halomonas sp. 18H]MDR5886908.1 membrane-bound lytic murein transglycosylase MltF [Halomonas janggokensis]QPL47382.1 membrane-bound lytic murein transglycosylase MltF [Halomonas sp. A40-4]
MPNSCYPDDRTIGHTSRSNRVIFSLLLPLVMLSGCGQSEPTITQIDPPEPGGSLNVVTRNSATTYYLDRHGNPAGPEHDLVEAFADANDWEVEWTLAESTSGVLQSLQGGEQQLAAAGLTHLPSRDEHFRQGPTHTDIVEQLVCHRDMRPMPRQVEEMAGVDIRVTEDSSYAAKLQSLVNQHTGIDFEEDPRTTEILLTEVAEKRIDCTVADSNIVQLVRRHFPHLEVAINLTSGDRLGWYLPANQQALANMADRWMATPEGQESINEVQQRYYAYISEFDFVDLRALNRRIDERLPDFLDLFLEAQEETGMPADLLAALAYQESHWDPQAVSPTGVRGIMMLTQNTAQSLGVDNRLNPAASIDGGARYLADRHQRLPDNLPEPDRTYLALASYNIGRGHVLDAQKLARELGKDPNSWEDMKEVLPLKADKRYYPQTRYGYARGYEPVHYVQRIRNYQDVIAPAMQWLPLSAGEP